MNKPITVARQEFVEKIVDVCNTSGLPAFMMLDVLMDTKGVLEDLAAKQLKDDVEKWQEWQAQQDQGKEDQVEVEVDE